MLGTKFSVKFELEIYFLNFVCFECFCVYLESDHERCSHILCCTLVLLYRFSSIVVIESVAQLTSTINTDYMQPPM